MFKKLLLSGLAMMAGTQIFAQANCGATAGEFTASTTPVQLLVTDVTSPPTFTVQPSGLPTTDFVITLQDSASTDGLGPAIIGASTTGNIFAPDAGMTIGDSFYVYAFSYDLQQVKLLIHSLFNNSIFPGFTCCSAAESLIPNFCANLSAQGISDSSDVQSVEDLFAVMEAFSGGAGSLSMSGLVQSLNQLNDNLAVFGACSGGINELCFAVDTFSYQFFEVTGVPVTTITVTGQGGATDITVDGGTLQMLADILPANATAQDVTWSVNNGTGVGSIDQTGMLTAFSNGTVDVIATATDGSGVYGMATITLSNQTGVAVSSITVSPNPGNITVSGGSLQLTANVLPANATNNAVVWSLVAGGFLATIDQNGLVTALANNDGQAIARATSTDGSMVYGEAVINISNQGSIEVTGISISPDPAYITAQNGTYTFTATLTPQDATNTNVTWSIVGNPLSADINNSGMATGYGEDTVQVVAEALGGTGVTDTATLIINFALGIGTISNDASLSMDVLPNPFDNQMNVRFSCVQSAEYQVRVVDMLGQVVSSQSQVLSAGTHQFTIETEALSAGMYWLQIQHKGGMIAQKVLKK